MRIAGFAVVHGGGASCYECGVHRGASLEQQTVRDHQVIDGGQGLFGQLVLGLGVFFMLRLKSKLTCFIDQ